MKPIRIIFFALVLIGATGFWFGDDAEEDTPEAPESQSQEDQQDLKAYLSEEALVKSRDWQPPNYDGQGTALGYTSDTFAVPRGLEARVEFWVDIYSKYTTHQGVMHDSHNPEIVLAEMDFTNVHSQKERRKIIKEKKKELSAILTKLDSVTDPSQLSPQELEIYRKYDGVNEPRKFKNAAAKGRIRFQLGQKDRFIQGVYYSGRYLKQMEEIFRNEGLPIELTRLPFVESSFNIYARSKVGASGVWQFMRRTARNYMHVDPLVDERNDPIRATRASARLLRSNYQLLGSWPLALTAYNHGPTGVHKLTQKLSTRDLVEIIQKEKSNRFGFASSNFYACFLAALRVEQQAKRFLGNVKWSETLDNKEIDLDKPVLYKDLLTIFDGNMDMAELYNPHFSRGIRKGRSQIPSRTFIRVPASREAMALAVLRNSKEAVAAAAPIQELVKSSAVASKSFGGVPMPLTDDKTYRVRRGDSLYQIARELGVSMNELREFNDLPSNGRLRPGQLLKVP